MTSDAQAPSPTTATSTVVTPAPKVPAATLVLFRDAILKRGEALAHPSGHPPEHLFVERASTMAFAGGAVVFPGGRVDSGDRELAVRYPDLDPDDAAARIAAVRETIEEAGVAVGLPAGVDIDALRLGLAQGRDFAALLDDAGVALDLSGLTPFARWCPDFDDVRTFDTRFYLARAPAHADARVDGTENVRLFWSTAQRVLDQADAGTVAVIFPTQCNLERLAALGSLDAAVADAAARPLRTITPWIEHRDGDRYLCIPRDAGYPHVAAQLAAARRR